MPRIDRIAHAFIIIDKIYRQRGVYIEAQLQKKPSQKTNNMSSAAIIPLNYPKDPIGDEQTYKDQIESRFSGNYHQESHT
jgi:hypothetical protein